MIFYYSATGNTRYAAEILGRKIGEKAVNILELSEIPAISGPVGLMFPIYCWGIPPVMSLFIGRLLPLIPKDSYVWSVCTCGDEAGTAMRTLGKTVEKATGRPVDACWSLIMPNTYVMLPGFGTDSEEVEKAKLSASHASLDEIARQITSRASGIYEVHEGSFPSLRSAIFPIFKKWGVNTKWWHVSDACISCGKCAKTCPAVNITMTDGHPVWGDNCYSCCACYHCCPVKAISYASFTKNKSQYHGPLNKL